MRTNNAYSGLPDIAPKRPYSYAERLARYISCPSTIRVRTLEHFGTAPPLSTIRQFRERVEAERAAFEKNRPEAETPKPKPALLIVASAPAPKVRPPRRSLWPTWYKPSRLPIRTKALAGGFDRTPWPKWYAVPGACLTGNNLVAAVARDFGFTGADLKGKARRYDLARARSVVVRIMLDRGVSSTQIGKILGGRDHSTILHSRDMFDAYSQRDARVGASYAFNRGRAA